MEGSQRLRAPRSRGAESLPRKGCSVEYGQGKAKEDETATSRHGNSRDQQRPLRMRWENRQIDNPRAGGVSPVGLRQQGSRPPRRVLKSFLSTERGASPTARPPALLHFSPISACFVVMPNEFGVAVAQIEEQLFSRCLADAHRDGVLATKCRSRSSDSGLRGAADGRRNGDAELQLLPLSMMNSWPRRSGPGQVLVLSRCRPSTARCR